ncbi:PucR family transcriptional regulator [Guptibacillus algicola]|uniref:PucR family transcriptional regulator n=1 Tax=Guptibacillus algicola TaxID=225844 RepID=UPI001CD4A0A4|nr:PucR family transcriptional regulator [Alkalihalobacillus algicola]MCA0988183.1 PucR family transcriptional regulator ligand-binding domain-containing protein [Alkalihalobacillus algicola]
MGITVNEALQLNEMKEIKLIAGKQGLHQEIKWITIVEVMEDVSRLHEGDFLITTAYGWNEKSEFYTKLIDTLASRKLSALAIHTGFYLDVIPIGIIEAANRTGLPLLEIPRTMNFSTVTRSILEQLVNKQLSLLAYTQRIQKDLTSLVLKNVGLSVITEALSKLINGNVVLYDENNNLLASSTLVHRRTTIEEIMPIIGHDRTIGRMVVQKELELTSLDMLALEQASTIFAIEFLKLQIIEETRIHIHADFLDTLLSKNYESEKAILKKSSDLGFDFSGKNRVLIVTSENDKCLDNYVQERILSHKTKGIGKRKIDHLILLLTGDTLEIDETHCKNFYIGVSSTVTGIRDLDQALKEAYTSHLFARYKEKPLVEYDELGVYKMFIQLKENGVDLKTYYEPLLLPIIQYDEKHHAQLLKTLETFLENNLVINRTAEKLYIHRHTLNYRVKQLENLTGIDIYSYELRTHIQLALLAYVTDQVLSN